jgi:protein-disulfide isomerase
MRALLLAMVGLLAVQPTVAQAQAASQAAAGPRLTIEGVVPDADTGTLTISGANFGPRPFVTLDLVPLNLQLVIEARVVAVAPLAMMPPGTYLLTVARGPRTGESASFEVRLGPEPPSTATGSAASDPASAPSIDAPVPATTDAAATVGDTVITVADVDREWQRTDPAGYLRAVRQLHDGRRRVAADLVNRELLAREARARGTTVEALLAEELKLRTVPLPDTAVSALYQSLGDRARGASLDQMRPALRAWLTRKTEPELARMAYLEELVKVSTRADTLLTAPRVTVAQSADDPTLGSTLAPVEVVMFGDFADPVYARYALMVPRVRESFGSRVRFVFKHLPSPDSASVEAAEAAACANTQGRFWEFHDTLLGRAGALDRARYRAVAGEVQLDVTKLDACLDAGTMRARVRAAVDEARRYGITSSGSILVNGRLAPEPPSFLPPFEFFRRLVEEELQRQATSAPRP